mmetsp:Transcript_43253/g.99709  ORF Transcript_43253/g.99709 Transcript_43253/m.99709 type:complete len:240 (-) Transcript_43253:756-1475(-)
MLLHLLKPLFNMLEGRSVSSVVNKDETVRVPVIIACHHRKAFLAGGVPELKLHQSTLHHGNNCLEVNTNGRDVEIRVIILDEACEQTGLPDSRVANCNKFEFEFSLRRGTFHLQNIQEEQLLADAWLVFLLCLVRQFVAHAAKDDQLVVEDCRGVRPHIHLTLVQRPRPTHVWDIQNVKIADARGRGPSEDKSPFANEIEAMEATLQWWGARYLHLGPCRSGYLVSEEEPGIRRWSCRG